MGEFEHGIFDGIWSPDREILVLVTLAEPEEDSSNSSPSSAILCMTATFDVLAEVPLEPHDVKEPVHLVWRPDGTLLGVSSVDQADQQRKIRIYQREPFQLAAVGRTEDGSGKLIPNIQSTPLAWAGPGCSQLLASITPKGRKDLQVSFLEPNGLRHGQFLLRLTDAANTVVRGMAWNATSDIFMVHLSEASYDSVQLWTRSNYHWYLKWNQRFDERSSGVVLDEEDPYSFDVLLRTGEWKEYKVRWETSNVDAFGTALVVDGTQLLLTPLEKALVPPPMAAASITLLAPVVDIIIDGIHTYNGDGALFAVVLSDGYIAVFGGNDALANSMIANYSPPVLKALVPLPKEALSCRSWCIVQECKNGELELVAAKAGAQYATEQLVHLQINWKERPSEAIANITNQVPLENCLLAAVSWADDTCGALLELVDGELLEYRPENGTVVPVDDSATLLEPCPWIAGLKCPSSPVSKEMHRQRLVLGMSERRRLFCHDLLLSDSISSFVLDTKHHFLCFATAESRCELRFIPLAELIEFDPLAGLDETLPLLRGYEPRQVERGSCVVAVLSKPSAVLQMPRGNLEGIYPRALVLQHCMQQIYSYEFGQSFALMRRQKVDVNLLVDMDPNGFLSHGATKLIDQIENIDHLNLFISSLQNWDSTMARYPVPMWLDKSLGNDSEMSREFDFSCKVNKVCQKLRSIMIQAEDEGRTAGGRAIRRSHFLLPILSTFAKEDPPQLEQALNLIKSNALASHGQGSRKPPLFSENAQHSIQYLAFLADYELLFDTALGMYDYDIARAVARNSQMDPKFYLPLLKQYRELPPFYGRFSVDVRLKRYEKALQNLYESGKAGEDLSGSPNDSNMVDQKGNGFEACFELIKQHKLHRLGLKLFRTTEQQNAIILDLGDALLSSNKANEALSLFLIACPVDKERVMKASRACWNWRIYFSHAFPQGKESMVDNAEIEAAKRQMVAREIAEELEASASQGREKRRVYAESARVLLDYASDVYGAVDSLLQGQWWDEARRIAILHNRDDLKRRCAEAAVSYAQTASEDVREKAQTFVEFSKRYEEVLQIRKTAYSSGEVDALGLPNDKPEDETGSMFSAASQASNLSSMSRGSTGSMGSVGSISTSTVISVKSTTSFSLSGADEAHRHKSKYNELGKKAKKKKNKKKTGRNRILPGSEQELQSIVESLRVSIIDEHYKEVLTNTIFFLCHERQLRAARDLYEAVRDSCNQMQDCQANRKDREEQRGKLFAKDNPGKEFVRHPSEEEIDVLKLISLSSEVQELMEYAVLVDSAY